MTPYGLDALFFDVHHNDVLLLNPLRLRIHEIMVKDASNMSLVELVLWAEEDAQTRTPKTKVVKHVVDDEDIPPVNLVESPMLKRSDKGNSIMVEDANTIKNAMEDGKSIMLEEDCLVRLPVRKKTFVDCYRERDPLMIPIFNMC
ncbi:hypothetical protein Tco_1519392, partial [Tanacetum coccineum]